MLKLFCKIKAAQFILLCIFTFQIISCQKNSVKSDDSSNTSDDKDKIEYIKPTILRIIPHDSLAFTQGLVFFNNFLFESNGKYGRSSLRKLNASSGEIIESYNLDQNYFGEGLAVSNNQFVQLTWQERTAFIYSHSPITEIDTFRYVGQGWGLTHDGNQFIMSDGSSNLTFRDKNFKKKRTISVTVEGLTLRFLNELEYVQNLIYSNVLESDSIFVIDPITGNVKKIIDCSELVEKANPQNPGYVLNGIAYDSSNNTFYCTGKNWKYMFEVIF
jgi:glutamine cyclotransferase